MRALGWTILSLVFLDELLAMAVWWAFGSPKAPYGGPVRRPVVKQLGFVRALIAGTETAVS
jgi:hypothetical protein